MKVLVGLRKQFTKIIFPLVDGGAPYPTKALELFQGTVGIFTLAKGRNDKQHRCPIYSSSPKPNRWWKDTAPTTFTTTTQAVANLKSFIKVRGAASRFSLVVGIVQRSPAVGQRPDLTFSAVLWSILWRRRNKDLRRRISGGIIGPAILVSVAGAPDYEPAKEREGAPSLFPLRSCPFFFIFPSFFPAVLNQVRAPGGQHSDLHECP